MAASTGAKVRHDDFVAAVHADPANPTPTRLVSGFVGHGGGDGKIRIYGDPSLGHWVEASTDDVVHSQPIADSPLGGSHVWLKSNAALTPGAAAGNAPVGGIGPDTGVFNPFNTIHPTLWTQIGCAPTHAPGCPGTSTCPPTHALGCPGTVTCPPHNTIATVCTQTGCNSFTHNVGCHITNGPLGGCPGPHPITLTSPCGPLTHGVGCPPSLTCTPTHILPCPPHITVATVCCGVTHFTCPPITLTCPVATGGVGCPGTSTCPIHQPGTETMMVAAPTHAFGCPNTSTCTPTYAFGCPNTSTCPPGA